VLSPLITSWAGVVTLERLSGFITDGYDKYPALVSCMFHVNPKLEKSMQQFAHIKLTPVTVQIGYVRRCASVGLS